MFNSIGGIGGLGWGGFFDYGAAVGFASIPIVGSTPSFLWSGAEAVGRIVGDWPPGFFGGRFGAVSNYIDYLLAQRGIGGPDKPPEKKRLPEGTDSPRYAERGVSYLREFIGGNKDLPSTSDVLRNLLGEMPKDEAEKAKYNKLWDDEKKKDKALRAVVEKIIGEWMNDPKGRGEFARKYEAAKDDIGRIRALLDPYGDGRYLKHLGQFVEGLSDPRDFDTAAANWEKIAGWFSANVGSDVLPSMAAESIAYARGRGLGAMTPLDQTAREKYIGKLVDKGYTREEAIVIMQPIGTKEEAEETIALMRDQSQSKTIIESEETKIKEYRERLKDAKLAAAERKQIETAINQIRGEIATYKRQRAERFLQDFMRVAEVRFGRTAQDFGYEAGRLPDGVIDVPTAARWAYGKLGFNVTIPEVKEEKAVETPPSPTGGGAGKPRAITLSSNTPTTSVESNPKFKGHPIKIVDGQNVYYCKDNQMKECVDDKGRIVRLQLPGAETQSQSPDVGGNASKKQAKAFRMATSKKFAGNDIDYWWQLTIADGSEQYYYCADDSNGNLDAARCVDKDGKKFELK